jgi:hypothetical protein
MSYELVPLVSNSEFQQAAEKVVFSRLLKKGQMQGPRNSEE